MPMNGKCRNGNTTPFTSDAGCCRDPEVQSKWAYPSGYDPKRCALNENPGDDVDQCIAKAKKYGQKYAATYYRNGYSQQYVYCEIGMTKGVLAYPTEDSWTKASYYSRLKKGGLWTAL